MKKQHNFGFIASSLLSIVTASSLNAQSVSEGQFWGNLQVSSPEAGSKLEPKPQNFSGNFESVTFVDGGSHGLSNRIIGNWSVDVASDLGDVTWGVVEDTKLFFDTVPGDNLVFTNPSIELVKYSSELAPINPIFFAGISPDKALFSEISEIYSESKFSIFVTDGKGYVEVISKDFTYELGSSSFKEGGLGYDPENKSYSTGGLSYVFFDGKDYQEFKSGDDFNAFAQFGHSYRCGPTVPEPTSSLLAIGSASLLFLRRRK
jgi:hypothetical protein